MSTIILANFRIFSYLLIIVVCILFIRKTHNKFIFFGNSIMAFSLMMNAIQSLLEGRSPASDLVYSSINISVFIWAMAHLLEIFYKEKK